MRTFIRIAGVVIGLAMLLPAVVLSQEDEEGTVAAKDTPYFSGMPNYRIADAYDKAFDDYRFYDGKGCVTVEGKKSHRAYTFKGEGETASELQIARNYVNAIKDMGGSIVFDGICESAECAENCGGRMVVAKILKGDNELWVEIVPFNDGGDYYITLIAKQTMKQDVTASGMLDALNRDGRVALYINFDFGKATIRPDSKPVIEQIIQMMKANPTLAVSVEGHTDSIGSASSNLSRRVLTPSD
jgi:OOP family OmpA-OmpF porin